MNFWVEDRLDLNDFTDAKDMINRLKKSPTECLSIVNEEIHKILLEIK